MDKFKALEPLENNENHLVTEALNTYRGLWSFMQRQWLCSKLQYY